MSDNKVNIMTVVFPDTGHCFTASVTEAHEEFSSRYMKPASWMEVVGPESIPFAYGAELLAQCEALLKCKQPLSAGFELHKLKALVAVIKLRSQML